MYNTGPIIRQTTGAQGPSGIATQTVEVPSTEFPTVTSVFTWVDDQGGVRPGHLLTISLVGDATYQYTDSFDWLDKDYSRVVIQGGTVASGMITKWTNFAGSLGAYTLDITVPEDVVSVASGAGYVLIETGLFPNNEDRAKVVGYWRVQSVVDATTLRVIIPSMDAMTAPVFSANLWRATVFKSMFRNYVNDKPFMRLTRSRGPMLKDVGLVGNYTFSGYAWDIRHTAIELNASSELRLPMDKMAAMTDRGFWVAVSGYYQGVVVCEASRLVGNLAVSGCDSFGWRADEGSVISCNQLYATSNGRGSPTWGVALTSGARIIAQAYTSRRASYVSGNAGRGVYCIEASHFNCQVGAAIGNTGNDVESASSGQTTMGETSRFALGSVSPAVNTLGNSNAYNRRY